MKPTGKPVQRKNLNTFVWIDGSFVLAATIAKLADEIDRYKTHPKA